MLIIRCDYHSRLQQIAMLDSQTGEVTERRLEHANGEAPSVLRRPFGSSPCENGGYWLRSGDRPAVAGKNC